MRFLFCLDLSLHAGAGKKNWNLELCIQTRPMYALCLSRYNNLMKKRSASLAQAWVMQILEGYIFQKFSDILPAIN